MFDIKVLLPAILHDCGFEYKQFWDGGLNGKLLLHRPTKDDEERFWDGCFMKRVCR